MRSTFALYVLRNSVFSSKKKSINKRRKQLKQQMFIKMPELRITVQFWPNYDFLAYSARKYMIIQIPNIFNFIQFKMSANKNQIPVNSRAFQYQFDLQIIKILIKPIEIPQPAFMEVVWRRGQNNITTKVKPDIKGHEDEILFNQKLSMISTCILNCDTKQFNMKQSVVTVVINLAGVNKTFGSIPLNLSTALNPKNQRETVVREIEQELSGKTKSRIILKLSSTYLKEMVKGEQHSVSSGVGSSKFNPNNTSSYSINYQNKKYQIPSKDSYSVISYGNSVRYSARKEESSSIRKDDSVKNEERSGKDYNYGYYNSSSSANNGYFARTSNQYNLNNRGNPSIPNSSSRPGRNSQSEANKSNAGGEQNSRLLQDQQNKRSKLQAENTKSKVENTELKTRLTEYVKENMKLKDELKKFGENNDSRCAQMKKENEQLLSKNYILTQQIREIKTRFDKFYHVEKQMNGVKEENQSLLRELKNYEQNLNKLRENQNMMRKQLFDAKDNQSKLKERIKEIEANKHDNEDARRRQTQNMIKQLQREVQYSQTNLKNLNFSLREAENSKNKMMRDLQEKENKIIEIQEEYRRQINNLQHEKTQEIAELKNQVNMKNQDSNRYLLELQKARSELQKIKYEKSHESAEKETMLTHEIQKLSTMVRQLNSKNDNLNRDKKGMQNQIKNDSYLRQKDAQKIKALEIKNSQIQKYKSLEINQLKRIIDDLKMQNDELCENLNQNKKKFEETERSKSQVNDLMKLNLQYELEVKYKNDELARLKNIEDQYENLKYKHEIQERNLKEIQQALNKCQKDLKEKTRAHILETERVRMLTEERTNTAKNHSQVKKELDEARNIIFNGERQVQEMDEYICECETKIRRLEQELKETINRANQIDREKIKQEITTLENRNKQLEKRNNEKLLTLQNLNRNLANANTEMRKLQNVSEQRTHELRKYQNISTETENRLKFVESEKYKIQQQLANESQERKNLLKKNQMLMEELFVYKKKLEQEKGKSTVNIRSSEQYMKVRNLQNELKKKEQKIGKLEKQLINLENENVKLNIEIMKKLDDYTPQ